MLVMPGVAWDLHLARVVSPCRLQWKVINGGHGKRLGELVGKNQETTGKNQDGGKLGNCSELHPGSPSFRAAGLTCGRSGRTELGPLTRELCFEENTKFAVKI